MAEAVVVLPPDERGQQVVQRGDRPPPGDVPRHLQPLGVLVEHRVDDVDEGLVAREEAVPAGQQIAFQPALALVLAEDFHHPAVRVQVVVVGQRLGDPGAVGDFEHVLPAVGVGLVRAEEAEVLAVQVHLHDVAEELAHDAASLRRHARRGWARPRRSPRKSGSFRSLSSRPPLACGLALMRFSPWGGSSASSGIKRARLVEQLLRLVALHPGFEDLDVPGLGHVGHRHLVRAPVTFGLLAIDLLRAGPALGRAEDDHGPERPLGEAILAGIGLDRLDLGRRLSSVSAMSWCIFAGSSPSTK